MPDRDERVCQSCFRPIQRDPHDRRRWVREADGSRECRDEYGRWIAAAHSPA